MNESSALKVVIASPHRRNEDLSARLAARLPHHDFLLVRSPEELTVERLEEIGPEFVFFPHWSWIIPETVHSRFRCVVFHMTDLPYGRGGSPLQNLIMRGHTETRISALQCVSELDAGPIYLKRPLSLDGTAEQILTRASSLIEEMIAEILTERPHPVPQTGEVVAFTRRRAEDGDIGRLENAGQVYDHIRMLDGEGYPPAFLDTAALRLEFKDARLAGDVVEATVRIARRPDAD